MIKADMTKPEVVIEGDLVEVLDEFTMVIRSLRVLLEKTQDKAFAERTIRFCVNLSNKTVEDLEKESCDETDDGKSVN